MIYDKSSLYPWAMLATNWDKVKNQIIYPVFVQPKLNGVRAKWCGKRQLFISRQGEVWPEFIIPHLYNQFQCAVDRDVDGELYCHGLKFQEIAQRVAVNKRNQHPLVSEIDFYVFDVISDDSTKIRMDALKQFDSHVEAQLCDDETAIDIWLASYIEQGYEGIMIRQLGCGYFNGRTEALIKLKPWQYADATIYGFVEGKGKNIGTLGALSVRSNLGDFRIGGGPGLDDAKRKEYWDNKYKYIGTTIKLRYRELSKSGLPLQPQIIL
jgi:DNA ligase 1